MVKNNTVVLIPARGGSKGLPGKNLAELAGKPLIAWTIEAALSSGCFNRVIVSTDSEDIKAIALDFGAEVPFVRPAKLASDTATACEVLHHAFKMMGDSYEICCYLQPTSPLREAISISSAMSKFSGADADSLVSVMKVPHQFTLGSVMELSGDYLKPLEKSSSGVYRRQDKPDMYARNGPAILVTRKSTLSQYKNLYGNSILPFEMGSRESVDIDSQDDLEYAEWLLSRLV